MSRKLLGMANHVHDKQTMSSLEVYELSGLQEEPVIVVSDGQEDILIYSLEQWAQLNALILRAFDNRGEHENN